ncbi:hypothetical protein ACLQ2H_09785 [Streptomyces globisporus]|uniref:hypothetical protein n=1 Tax=Streptomyces globisporus TaxID=1908 RepID=UPI003CE834D7
MCGCRREAKALATRTEMLVAAWSADVNNLDGGAVVRRRVRTGIDRKVASGWAEFLEITDPAELAADPARAEIAPTLTAQQIADQTAASALAAVWSDRRSRSRAPHQAGQEVVPAHPRQ